MSALVPVHATSSIYTAKLPRGAFGLPARAQGDWSDVADTFGRLRAFYLPLDDQLVLGANGGAGTITRDTNLSQSIDERLFATLVKLKVSVAQYAMHLSRDARHKLFDDLDAILNAGDWYEEDRLPEMKSFRDFLKWTIYSQRFNWISIGVSDDGNIQAAWKTDKGLLTGIYNGSGRVFWTARVVTDEGDDHVAGDSSLQSFERQTRFYLDPD